MYSDHGIQVRPASNPVFSSMGVSAGLEHEALIRRPYHNIPTTGANSLCPDFCPSHSKFDAASYKVDLQKNLMRRGPKGIWMGTFRHYVYVAHPAS